MSILDDDVSVQDRRSESVHAILSADMRGDGINLRNVAAEWRSRIVIFFILFLDLLIGGGIFTDVRHSTVVNKLVAFWRGDGM